ncbi:MAG: glutathione-dependent formaldehyde dehydrogenase, partial [Exiguobacterium profundum]
ELFQMIIDQKFDPTDIITHRLSLEHAADAYHLFNEHLDDCVKVVLKP